MKKFTALTLIQLAVICSMPATAQKLNDSSFKKVSREELGSYYMKKSRTNKAIGYVMLGAGLAGYGFLIHNSIQGNEGSGLLFWTSTIVLAASNPVLCSGSRYKGKAEMLLRKPGADETPSDIQALTAKYKSQRTASSIIAWTLFIGGFAGLIVAAGTGEDAIAVLSGAAMFASLPVWMNAAKNKGRVSILVQHQPLAYSYLSRNTGQTAIGISLPIGR